MCPVCTTAGPLLSEQPWSATISLFGTPSLTGPTLCVATVIGIFLLSEGPLATRFQFDLVSDFATRTQVDLGELGGKTLAKAKFEGNKLITHIHNKKTGVHFLTATREMDASEYHTKCKY